MEDVRGSPDREELTGVDRCCGHLQGCRTELQVWRSSTRLQDGALPVEPIPAGSWGLLPDGTDRGAVRKAAAAENRQQQQTGKKTGRRALPWRSGRCRRQQQRTGGSNRPERRPESSAVEEEENAGEDRGPSAAADSEEKRSGRAAANGEKGETRRRRTKRSSAGDSAKLVDFALASGKIYEGEGFKYIKECFDKGTLHLIGLLSDGGVHSRLDQLQLLLKGASENGAKRIRVHILTDGRDVLDGSSVGFVETLENDLWKLREKGVDAQIASGGGRMYVTMDRYENDWGVVKRGWDAQVLGEAPHKFRSAVEAVKKLREDPNANDQYLPPFVIVDESGKPVGPILDGDAVVTFNFRADRMVMIAKALEYEDFDKFDRVRVPKIHYAGMLQYDGELKLPKHYLVDPPEIERTSGEYLVHNGIRTFACSETVKFGHVTFFWNGNRSGYFDASMEEYVEIPSDAGITFNVQPKMKALEIAEKARDAILSRKFDQVRVNLPNGDMVGHTGDIEATVVACKAADEAVKMILDAIEQVGGIYVVTADHGNAEDMVKRNKSGQPALDKNGNIQVLTSHTLQPVPIAIGGPGLMHGVRFRSDVPDGGLANVAATVMNLHGFIAPSDYESTLIEVVDN